MKKPQTFQVGDRVVVRGSNAIPVDVRTVADVMNNDRNDGWGPTVVLDREWDGYREWCAADLVLVKS